MFSTMPGDVLLDSSLFHPITKGMKTGLHRGQREDQGVISGIVWFWPDYFKQHVIDRNHHTTLLAVPVGLALTEGNYAILIVHIPIRQYLQVTETNTREACHGKSATDDRVLTVVVCVEERFQFLSTKDVFDQHILLAVHNDAFTRTFLEQPI